jgi:ankyrin repeat protein
MQKLMKEVGNKNTFAAGAVSRPNGGNYNRLQDSLWQAVTDRDIDSVRKLVEKDEVDVDFIAPDGWVRESGHGGKSLLHHAAWIGDLTIFKLLVEHGADPHLPRSRNWARAKGFTPFHHACFYNRMGIVAYCLDHLDADVNAIGEDGFTPLHLAVKFGYVPLCRYLLDRGARFDIRNRQDKTAADITTNEDIKELFTQYRRGILKPSVAPSSSKPTVCLMHPS